MSFLFPLGFLFALAMPVIVAMYLLRLRRQKVKISSILLWRKSLEDLQANAPFQKLRNNLLLWIQLLIALLAVLALARPTMRLAPGKGQSYLAIVDTSASMQTKEASGTRMDQARDALETMIGNLKRGDEMMILAFDREARVVQAFSADKAILYSAARSLKARDSLSNLREAAAMARSVVRTRPSMELVIFSDGAIADLDRQPEGLPTIKYVPVGQATDNLGIVDVELRDTFDRVPERQLFVQIANYSKEPVTTLVQCLVDGAMTDAKELTIEPGKGGAAIFTGLKGKKGKLELRIQREDALALDNVAYGMLTEDDATRILLVSSGNHFLQKLLTIDPKNQVSLVATNAYTSSKGYDLTIFDNFVPATLEPGSYLILNALPPMPGFAKGPEALAYPAIVDWNRVHPISRYVKFDQITIEKAIDIDAPSWIQPLAEGPTSPLVFAFERDQRQVVCTAFDLFDSGDWQLRPSFPIFISNTIDWLTRMVSSGKQFSYSVGESVPVAASGDATQANVHTPSGTTRPIDLSQLRSAYFSQTDETGYYELTVGAEKRPFAVNLLSREESNIAPRSELAFKDLTIAGTPESVRSNREVWRWFAFGVLALLAGEWLVYCRRAWL